MIYQSSADLNKLTVTRADYPFPYAIIDNVFPSEIANELASTFPGPTDIEWDISHECPEAQRKLVCSSEHKFPNDIREALWFFHSETFVQYIEKVMGFSDLLIDPTHRGCGMHSTGRDGYVGIHSDSSRHPNTKLDQKLNLILWLNPEWNDEWGGALELWDRNGAACVVKIPPKHNRIALFETSTTGYHGHPARLQCPATRRRNSLAVYYYQVGRERNDTHDGWKEAPHFITKEPK